MSSLVLRYWMKNKKIPTKSEPQKSSMYLKIKLIPITNDLWNNIKSINREQYVSISISIIYTIWCINTSYVFIYSIQFVLYFVQFFSAFIGSKWAHVSSVIFFWNWEKKQQQQQQNVYCPNHHLYIEKIENLLISMRLPFLLLSIRII